MRTKLEAVVLAVMVLGRKVRQLRGITDQTRVVEYI